MRAPLKDKTQQAPLKDKTKLEIHKSVHESPAQGQNPIREQKYVLTIYS
jgi:hypothetical protein